MNMADRVVEDTNNGLKKYITHLKNIPSTPIFTDPPCAYEVGCRIQLNKDPSSEGTIVEERTGGWRLILFADGSEGRHRPSEMKIKFKCRLSAVDNALTLVTGRAFREGMASGPRDTIWLNSTSSPATTTYCFCWSREMATRVSSVAESDMEAHSGSPWHQPVDLSSLLPAREFPVHPSDLVGLLRGSRNESVDKECVHSRARNSMDLPDHCKPPSTKGSSLIAEHGVSTDDAAFSMGQVVVMPSPPGMVPGLGVSLGLDWALAALQEW